MESTSLAAWLMATAIILFVAVFIFKQLIETNSPFL